MGFQSRNVKIIRDMCRNEKSEMATLIVRPSCLLMWLVEVVNFKI